MTRLNLIIGIILVLTLSVAYAENNTPEFLYQKALYLETAKADYEGAIKIYEEIVKEKEKNAELVAKALYRMGICHEKLGNAEQAEECAMRLSKEFASQLPFIEGASEFIQRFYNERYDAAINEMIELLYSEDPTVILWGDPVIALGMIGDRKAVPHLLKILKKPDAGRQCYIIQALGRIGDKNAIPGIKELQKEENPEFLQQIIDDTLWKLSAEEAKEYPKDLKLTGERMLSIFSNEPAIIVAGADKKLSAAITLGLIKEKRAIEPFANFLKNAGRNPSDEFISMYVISALGRIGDESAVPVLISLLEDKNYEKLQIFTLNALKKIKSKKAVPALKKFVKESKGTAKIAAKEALSEITGERFTIDESDHIESFNEITEKMSKLIEKGAFKDDIKIDLKDSKDRPYEAMCSSNLQLIGLNIHAFAIDNNGRFPGKLDDLYPKYIPELNTFRCSSTGLAYLYVPGFTENSDSNFILAFDRKDNHKEGRNVLFLDGHSKRMGEEDFQRVLTEMAKKINVENFSQWMEKLLQQSNELNERIKKVGGEYKKELPGVFLKSKEDLLKETKEILYPKCKENLGRIDMAIKGYCIEHDNKMPANLIDLYPKYIKGRSILKCPDSDEDYCYVEGLDYILDLEHQKTTVMVYDKSPIHREGRNVLFLSGEVKWVEEAEFKKMLKEGKKMIQPHLEPPFEDIIMAPLAYSTDFKEFNTSPHSFGGAFLKKEPIEKLHREPQYNSSPLYGSLILGNGEDRIITVAVEDMKEKKYLVYIDANNNEDLSDDIAVQLADGRKILFDSVMIDYKDGSHPLRIELEVTRGYQDMQKLHISTACLYKGEISIEDKRYKLAIFDKGGNGCFNDLSPALTLYEKDQIIIDVNLDGLADGSSESKESFEMDKVFYLDGSPYKIFSVSAQGNQIAIIKAPEGQLIGTITNINNGESISNATLYIGPSNLSPIKVKDSSYSIFLGEGPYVVSVTADGYIPVFKNQVEIEANKVNMFNFSLLPAPPIKVSQCELKIKESLHAIAQKLEKHSEGDFYLTKNGKLYFCANQERQRGTQDIGDLGSLELEKVTIPKNKYVWWGVPVVLNHYYVALAREPEEDHYVVFKVIEISETSVKIEYLYR